MDEVRILEIKQSVFKNNDEQADKLRRELKEKGVFLLNLMSSPGAGKTTTLKATIAALKDKVKIGVMEADIDSDVDAKRIAETGVKAIQLLTDSRPAMLNSQYSRMSATSSAPQSSTREPLKMR